MSRRVTGRRKRGQGGVTVSAATLSARAAFKGLAAEYGCYDGLGLAKLIAKKHISAVELLNAVHERVEATNPKLNAVCQRFFDKAEAQIKKVPSNSPFKGVPFALKDIGHQLAGTPTTSGSRLFKDNVPDFDSTLVARYKQAGLVIFAKTSTPELGVSMSTESVLFGQTHNPWRFERTPGGSSGGSAALVASRILPMAHASDGGGSIRIPASCCGVFGLKPTRGRVPLGPVQLEGWNGLSAHHALTISVRDSAALLDVAAGAELGSPYWAPPPRRPFLKEVGANPSKLRIALWLKPPMGAKLSSVCRKAVMDAGWLCEELGHRVEEAQPALDFQALAKAFAAVRNVSIARMLEDRARSLGRTLMEEDLEPVTWAFYQMGLRVSSVEYSRGIATCHQAGVAMAKFHQNYDVILNPTLAKPPVPLGVLSLSRTDVQAFLTEVTAFSPYTRLINMTGQPSMSVPLYWSSEGLPIGTMFSAPFGDEATLFRLASQLEEARPWACRVPNI